MESQLLNVLAYISGFVAIIQSVLWSTVLIGKLTSPKIKDQARLFISSVGFFFVYGLCLWVLHAPIFGGIFGHRLTMWIFVIAGSICASIIVIKLYGGVVGLNSDKYGIAEYVTIIMTSAAYGVFSFGGISILYDHVIDGSDTFRGVVSWSLSWGVTGIIISFIFFPLGLFLAKVYRN